MAAKFLTDFPFETGDDKAAGSRGTPNAPGITATTELPGTLPYDARSGLLEETERQSSRVIARKKVGNPFRTRLFRLISLPAKFPAVSCPVQLAGLALPNVSLTVENLVRERRRTEHLHPSAVCRKHGIRCQRGPQ